METIKNLPLISVIIPVYNVEDYLDRCIKSILSQTFRNFEIIIIDDGSPDKCPEICEKWAVKDERIVVIHQKNQGLSAARNLGIRNAKGEFLTFVDSDDWISENMLEVLLDLVRKYDADISICNFVKTDKKKEIVVRDEVIEKVYSRDDFMNIILKVHSNRTIHYAWGKLYKRKVIDDTHYPVGMLNEDVEGMFKAVIRSERIAETTSVGYFYYENNDSITRKKFGGNFLCLNEVWSRVLKIAEQFAPEYRDKVEFNLKRTDFTILVDMLLYGDREADKRYESEITEARSRLKRNINILLSGPMIAKRKVLVFLICYLYLPVREIIRIKDLVFKR